MQSSTISAISTTVPFTLIIWLLKSILLTTVVECWPDGSPCTTSTIMESMDPSEAPEHRGGLQLTTPPFTIDVKDDCYVKNRPIERKSIII
ncbi:hypothetical protein AB6A40_005030 [Gnathostoma spinigerum]|uniref:Secreted protein n=1 Tax=Gnathostoma spinigerum TaxID=75299 RepID=A0ABD6EF86_9BILA